MDVILVGTCLSAAAYLLPGSTIVFMALGVGLCGVSQGALLQQWVTVLAGRPNHEVGLAAALLVLTFSLALLALWLAKSFALAALSLGQLASAALLGRADETDATTPSGELYQSNLLALRHSLTARELEVLAILARGNTLARVQHDLVISEGTAITHRKNVYRKLGVHSRQELLDLVREAEAEIASKG